MVFYINFVQILVYFCGLSCARIQILKMEQNAYVYNGATFQFTQKYPIPVLPKPTSIEKYLVSVKAVSLNPVDYKLGKIPVVSWSLKGSPVGQDFSGIILGIDRYLQSISFNIHV